MGLIDFDPFRVDDDGEHPVALPLAIELMPFGHGRKPTATKLPVEGFQSLVERIQRPVELYT